jgi:hypothetical protein
LKKGSDQSPPLIGIRPVATTGAMGDFYAKVRPLEKPSAEQISQPPKKEYEELKSSTILIVNHH